MREYFKAVIDNDYAVPGDRPLPELLDELWEGLTSPDPNLRDWIAYPVLITWVTKGVLDAHARQIGDRSADMLGHKEIQARTFAALILAGLIERDNAAHTVDAADAHRWFTRFAEWWTTEPDQRGYDDTLGWLHAAAHGADTLGAYADSRHLTATGLKDLLATAATRLTADTDQLWGAQEDDRIARSCGRILARPELSEAEATGWLTTVADTLTANAKPGPIPAWVQNTFHTLKSLYVHVDREFTVDGNTVTARHADALRDKITETLRIGWPTLLP